MQQQQQQNELNEFSFLSARIISIWNTSIKAKQTTVLNYWNYVKQSVLRVFQLSWIFHAEMCVGEMKVKEIERNFAKLQQMSW